MTLIDRSTHYFFNNFVPWIQQWLFLSIITQLCAFVISVPFIVGWGLPFSWLSFPGNLFFAPWIFVFLALSLMLFITTSMGLIIPFIGQALDVVIYGWLGIMQHGTPRFYYGQINHPLMLAALAGCTMSTLYFIGTATHKKNIFRYLLISSLTLTTLIYLPIGKTISFMQRNKQSAKVLYHRGSGVVIYDHGYISHLRRPEKNITFGVRRHLLTSHGTTCIKQLHFDKIGPKTPGIIDLLAQTTTLKEIVLPDNKKLQKIRTELALTCAKHKINLKIQTPKLRFTPTN